MFKKMKQGVASAAEGAKERSRTIVGKGKPSLSEAVAKAEELGQKLEELSTQSHKQSELLQQAQRRAQAAEKASGMLEEKLNTANSKLNSQMEKHAKLQETFDAMEENLQKRTESMGDVGKRLEQLEGDNSTLAEELAARNAELEELRSNDQAMQDAAASGGAAMNQQVAEATRRAAEAEKIRSQTEQLAIDSQIAAEKAEAEMVEMRRHLSRLKEEADFAARRDQIDEYTRGCSKTAALITDLEHELRSSQADPALMAPGNGGARRHIDKITKRLAIAQKGQENQLRALAQLKDRENLQRLWLAAAADGDTEQLEGLLDQGIVVNEADEYGFRALHYAAGNGKLEAVRLLLKLGVDHHKSARCPNSCLIVAASKGQADVVSLLLDAGAELESVDSQGRTALQAACGKTLLDVVRLLLERGAYIDTQDNEGETCLHLAAKCGDNDITRLLMSSGARSDLTNNKCKTPIDIGIDCKWMNVVQTIRIMRSAPRTVVNRKGSQQTVAKEGLTAAETHRQKDAAMGNGTSLDALDPCASSENLGGNNTGPAVDEVVSSSSASAATSTINGEGDVAGASLSSQSVPLLTDIKKGSFSSGDGGVVTDARSGLKLQKSGSRAGLVVGSEAVRPV
jgi:hypothetical protein